MFLMETPTDSQIRWQNLVMWQGIRTAQEHIAHVLAAQHSCVNAAEKSVWNIWSKILNKNIIHKTSFKVSTSRVPFPTNGREKLGQRRRTKSQSRLLAAEYFDSTKCFAKYFVSHCVIHKLKSRASTKCSAILLGAKLFGRFGAKFWIKILYTKLLSRFPLPEFRFLLMEEKNWDKGDGQSYNLNYSRQNILSAPMPSTIWRNLQISKICFRFGLYYSQQKFWPGFAFQKSCSSFQNSISVSVFRFQKGCSLLLAEYFASHCGIRSFNSQRCTLFGLQCTYYTM